MEVSRRKFLGSTAAAVIVAGTRVTGKVFGANSRVRMVCVGLNGRGASHIKGFTEYEGSEVVGLCDVDSHVLDIAAGTFEKNTGKKPMLAKDIRDLLAKSEVDAISIATPNNAHTMIAVWACQAGKDVYVEKPLCHDFWEGKQLVAWAEKTKRVVQHGTQSRSDPKFRMAIEKIQKGAIGEVHTARGCVYKNGNRGALEHHEDSDPPATLDWNLWQGPATEKKFNANYHPYNWHWFWHYGNGEIGNQGVHQMDVAAWGMNKGLPVKVYSSGGRYTYKDQGETPNTNTAQFTYADGTELIFDVRNRFTNDEAGVKVGNMFYGSEGYWVQDKGFFDKNDKPLTVEGDLPTSKGPFGNFIEAVKSRKPEDIHGSMSEGFISCAHIHLANISYRLGRSLVFDPKTETFPGSDDATKMLKREYRKGFEVPEVA